MHSSESSETKSSVCQQIGPRSLTVWFHKGRVYARAEGPRKTLDLVGLHGCWGHYNFAEHGEIAQIEKDLANRVMPMPTVHHLPFLMEHLGWKTRDERELVLEEFMPVFKRLRDQEQREHAEGLQKLSDYRREHG